MKHIAILGSTGSIGTQTLECVDCLDNIKISFITTNTKTNILKSQLEKYNPDFAVITDEKSYDTFINTYKGSTKILFGHQSILELISSANIDILINSLVGNIGLPPTICAIENKIDIALANKEVLVTAGEIIMNMAKENDVNIYPIDSEHSAIFQCLQGNAHNEINKIYLTCSGGSFRGYNGEQLKNVTVNDALKHPNWEMGKKITIDSATLMNKGLEVIEARWLFSVAPENIEVVIHKESIIHSMVEFTDGAIMAQLGTPDMRLPISYAINYPNRINLPFEKLNIFDKNLTFEKPDLDNFRCLSLAYKALEQGGLMPCVLNASNEALVSLFLEEKIAFLDIPKYVEMAMSHFFNTKLAYNLENIYIITNEVNEYIRNIVKTEEM